MRFEYIWIDETQYLSEEAQAKTGRHHSLYIFTPDERTYCCELQPSYWMEAAGFETKNVIDDELWDSLNAYLCDSSHYRHCGCVPGFNPKFLGDFENLNDAREYAMGNPPCH